MFGIAKQFNSSSRGFFQIGGQFDETNGTIQMSFLGDLSGPRIDLGISLSVVAGNLRYRSPKSAGHLSSLRLHGSSMVGTFIR